MPANIATSESSRPKPVGEAAEEKPAHRAADADDADQQDRPRWRDTVIDRIRSEVDEGDEYAEGASEACGIEADEPTRFDGVFDRRAGWLRRLRAGE
jgi:hypothetical protein